MWGLLMLIAGFFIGRASRNKEIEALKEGMRIWTRWAEKKIDAKEAAKQFQKIHDNL